MLAELEEMTTADVSQIRLYCGSATPQLAAAVAERLGVELGQRRLRRFPDGEVHVQIDESIRGRDIFIIQSTCQPVNENLMELLVMVDAFQRASAGRVTAVIPYYGYARQEKKSTGREPITARMVADLLAAVGTDRVVSIDLHAPAIQGFFNIWMDHLTAVPLLARHLRTISLDDVAVVSPDVGRAKLAEKYAAALDAPLVILHKERLDAEETRVRAVIGDIKGRPAVLIDDMISTGSTIATAVDALLAAGARPEITVVATHPLLVGQAPERLAHEAIFRVVVTDTIPISGEKRTRLGNKLAVVSVAELLAETIGRLHRNQSVSQVFDQFGLRAQVQPV